MVNYCVNTSITISTTIGISISIAYITVNISINISKFSLSVLAFLTILLLVNSCSIKKLAKPSINRNLLNKSFNAYFPSQEFPK